MNRLLVKLKRVVIVGAAAVVGLVPIGVLNTSAYAVSGALLSLGSTVPGQTTSATNTFTVANATSAGTTEYLTVTANSGEQLPTSAVDYSVTVGGVNDAVNTSYTGTGAFAVTNPNGAGNPPWVATLPLTTAASAGQQVVVTITGVVNPTANASVYFTDQASSDTALPAANTNTVAVAGAAGAAATVASVNPQAFQAAAGELFTVTGSGFGTAATTGLPTVCFIPVATTTIPAACPAASDEATSVTATSTEIQGASPALSAGTQYNVVVYNTGAAGSATSAATVVATSAPGSLNFIPESGVRVIDTRAGLGMPVGALTPGTVYTIPESTLFYNTPAVPTNVPQTAEGVVFNVTAVAPSGAGNLQVWEAGNCIANKDVRSVVNFQPPQDTNNSNIVIVGPNGNLCVQDNGASVNVVMDVTGYMTNDYTPRIPSDPTTRILDSRPGAPSVQNLIQGPLAGGVVYRLPVPVEAGATAYVLNVTAVGPTAAGNLRVFPEPTGGAPAPSGVPNTAVDTYIPGVDGGSMFVTTLGDIGTTVNPSTTTGYIDLYSDSTGTVNVVIDEIGYFTTGSSVIPITPVRMIDTRPGGVAAGGMTSFTAVPFAAIPTDIPSSALGVIGDLANIQPTSPGYLVTYPNGDVMPGTANIANYPGQTRSTTAFAAVNPSNGMVSVSSVGASTNFTFDATAYIDSGAVP